MKKIASVFIATLLLVFIACKQKIYDVAIKTGISSTIDLKKGLYVVFYQDKPPAEVKFSLSQYEIENINAMAKRLYLSISETELNIVDTCLSIPKIITRIDIEINGKRKNIFIDMNCAGDSGIDETEKAKQTNALVSQIAKIIHAKPRVKEITGSDILYY